MDAQSLVILGALCLLFAIAGAVVQSLIGIARRVLLIAGVAALLGAIGMTVLPGS